LLPAKISLLISFALIDKRSFTKIIMKEGGSRLSIL
jgi:hypothetical protein